MKRRRMVIAAAGALGLLAGVMACAVFTKWIVMGALILAILSIAWRSKWILAPWVVFPVAFLAYYVPGSFNIGVTAHGMEAVNQAQLGVVYGVALASFLVGCVIGWRWQVYGRGVARCWSTLEESIDVSELRRIVIVYVCLGLVFAAVPLGLAAVHHVLPTETGSRGAFRVYTPNDVYTMFWYLVVGLALAWWAIQRDPGYAVLYVAFLVVGGGVLTLTASRFWLGYALLTGLLIASRNVRSRKVVWLLIAAAGAMAIIWLVWEIRLRGSYGQLHVGLLTSLYLFSRTNVESLQAALIAFPHEHGWLYGQFIFGRWLDLIPFTHGANPGSLMTVDLWHNPPVVGTTPSLPGAFYVDFGWPGIVVGFGILGVMLSAIYAIAPNGRGPSSVMYATLLAFWVVSLYTSEPFHVYLAWEMVLMGAAVYPIHGDGRSARGLGLVRFVRALGTVAGAMQLALLVFVGSSVKIL